MNTFNHSFQPFLFAATPFKEPYSLEEKWKEDARQWELEHPEEHAADVQEAKAREQGACDIILCGAIFIVGLVTFIHLSVNKEIEKVYGPQPFHIRVLATVLGCMSVYAGSKVLNKIIGKKK